MKSLSTRDLLIIVALLFVVRVFPALADERSVNPTSAPAAAKTAIKEAGGGDIEVLRQQLKAQQDISNQLRKRILQLEKQLTPEESNVLDATALDSMATKPSAEPEDKRVTGAIEEALVSKGLILLPAWTLRFVPSGSFVHSGSGDERKDTYSTSLGLDLGLPWGMMFSAAVPYIWLDYGYGSNAGWGDTSIVLRKKLLNEGNVLPALTASVSYIHDTGEQTFTPLATGSGFPSAGGTLSASKRFDPLILFGNISYNHVFERSAVIHDSTGQEVFRGNINPGNSYGFALGVSLAVTPEISLDAGLSFAFPDRTQFRSEDGSFSEFDRITIGTMSLGSGFLLTKNLFLYLSASAGVTDDTSDFIFSIALPYKF